MLTQVRNKSSLARRLIQICNVQDLRTHEDSTTVPPGEKEFFYEVDVLQDLEHISMRENRYGGRVRQSSGLDQSFAQPLFARIITDTSPQQDDKTHYPQTSVSLSAKTVERSSSRSEHFDSVADDD